MKEHAKQGYTRKVTIRFREEEYQSLVSRFHTTTKRKFSEYLRDHLLQKKLTVKSRNASLDDLVMELVQLRRELNVMGNNFNQAVKRLHKMEHVMELKAWVLINEKSKELFFLKVAQIQSKIDRIADQW
ncbi:MAG: mobilization protein [Flaviaesturariibacter sp.]|nr:mobilization protein [Flaviaesturariibacter sp.]